MTPLLQQLYGLRLILDGLIATVEQELGAAVGAASVVGACPHPPERQVDATVMGGEPKIMCLVCGTERAGVIQQ